MDKLIVYALPNYINIPIIILGVMIVVSFIVLIFAAITDKETLGISANAVLIISLMLSFAIGVYVSIANRIIVDEKSYTITKTNDTIHVNSHSDWVDDTTYNIIGHKDGVYYLENDGCRGTIIKLSDNEFEKITNQQ